MNLITAYPQTFIANRLRQGLRLLGVVYLAGASSAVMAGSAAISKDGTRLYVPSEEFEVTGAVIDLEKGTRKSFDPKSFGAPAATRYRSTSKSGFLIGDAMDEIVASDPDKKKTVVLGKVPKGSTVVDLAYHPVDGSVIVALTPDDPSKTDGPEIPVLFQIPKDSSKGRAVFCRRVTYVDGIAISPEGKLAIATRGDLWVGTIEPNDDGGTYLDAERIAPLANLETSLGTAAQEGIREVAWVKNQVIVSTRRMGGSGWGNVFTLTPAPGDVNSTGDPISAITRRMIKTLQSVEHIGTNSHEAWISSTPDGTKGALALRPEKGIEVYTITPGVKPRLVGTLSNEE